MKHRKNVDPVLVATQASSMAYNLAVARELGKLQRKNGKKNPALAKHIKKLKDDIKYRKNINWPDLIATGAGTAIGASVGTAIIDPAIAAIQRKGKTRKNPTLLIASNPGGTRRKRPKRGFDPNDPEFKAALKKYREFFKGTDPVEVTEVQTKVPMPKYLVALGEAPEVTYKPGDHTPKKGVPFKHIFGEDGGHPPLLVTDKTGKYLGYVGGTFRVRDWIID